MKLKITCIAAALVSVSASSVDARDPFVGEYSASCRPEHQCWVEIDAGDNGYTFRWVTADRMDAGKVYCSVEGPLEVDGNFLRGKFEDRDLEVFRMSDGGLAFQTGDNRACGRTLPVNGAYDPLGY